MILCPHCQAQNPDGAQVCSACNGSLTRAFHTHDAEYGDVASDASAPMLSPEVARSLRMARGYAKSGQYDQAKEIYDQLIADDPQCVDAYIGYIRVESQNFTILEGESIDQLIDLTCQLFPDLKLSDVDLDFRDYEERRVTAAADALVAAAAAFSTPEPEPEPEPEPTSVSFDFDLAASIDRQWQGSTSSSASSVGDLDQQLAAAVERELGASMGSSVQPRSSDQFQFQGTVLIRAQKTITRAVIPAGTTAIAPHAFEDCDKLTEVTFADNSVTVIAEQAFRKCSALRSIHLPSNLKVVGPSAFSLCGLLTSLVFPRTVNRIGNSVVEWCHSIETLRVESGNPIYHSSGNCIIETASKTLIAGATNCIIPSDGSVTSIADSAINGMDMERIVVPASVARLEEYAFCGCDELETVQLSYGLRFIGCNAFYLCSKLRNINIPASVVEMEEDIFDECEMLTSITYNGTRSQWRSIRKQSLGQPLTVYCTDGRVQEN